MGYSEQERKGCGPIVIVSGSPQDDSAMTSELAKAGYEIIAISEAKRVLDLPETKPRGWMPSIIIIETIIPRSSGFELVRQVGKTFDPEKVSIFMMSKYRSREDELESGAAGARGLMLKPLTPDILDSFIEKERMRKIKAEIGKQVIK